MHKSRRKYYSRGSAQTPRPTEEPRGQEGQVQHPGNREKQQKAKDPLNHPEPKLKGGRRVRGRPSGGGRENSTRIAVELTREVVTPKGGGTPTPTPGPYEKKKPTPKR